MEQPTVKIQETFKRTVVKTLIWRVIAILTTIILAVLLYNDLQKAATLGLADYIFKLVIHFIFERIWNKILWGFEEVAVDIESEEEFSVEVPNIPVPK